MTSLTLHLPDETPLALRTRTEAELGQSLLLAAAVKYYEMGHLSAGAAANLAGIPKPLFLARLTDFGVAALDLEPDEFAKETRLV